MKCMNDYRMRMMLVVVVAAMVLGGSRAKADFTFGTPTNLGSPVNSSSTERMPSVSADGLTLYFTSDRPGGQGDFDIWLSELEAGQNPTELVWSQPINLGPPINTTSLDCHPNISFDGLTLFFTSNRAGGYGDRDLWMSTRLTISEPWSEPVNLGPKVNSSSRENGPSISADGLELFFQSNRPGGYGDNDIWVTTREMIDKPWGDPVNLGQELNSPFLDGVPDISSDGLMLFFRSRKSGTYGSSDVWFSKRITINDDWGIPVHPGPPVNTSASDSSPNISADGSVLYFHSTRADGLGDYDLWQVPLIPIVDLNGDGIVDAADRGIMVDHWGEDYPLCDIGPMPWGDGIVDVEDLKVIAEYLFTYPGTTAYWKLDEMEGDIAYDSAHGYDGVLIGGPVWQPDGGMMDGALHFDGIDDFVGTDFVLDPAHNLFSVFSWIKGGAPGQVVISQADGVNWLSADPSAGKLMTSLSRPPGGRVLAPPPLVSESVITDDTWHCIGFVWDGLCRTLYVDGTKVAKDPVSLPGLESAEGGLHFGTGSTLAPGSFFSGLIDDVRIYNRVVSP